MGAYVALLLVHLHLPGVGDLKGKRKMIASLKGQLSARLGAAVGEVDHQDLHQRATLSAALTGPSLRELDRGLDRIERLVLDRHPEGASFERFVVSDEDLRGMI
jgi:uncharacterized protein YlxP (DUF503 family)